VKKLIWFFFTSFRRKPESSVLTALRIDWTPVFTGVTPETQFFHTFRVGWGKNALIPILESFDAAKRVGIRVLKKTILNFGN